MADSTIHDSVESFDFVCRWCGETNCVELGHLLAGPIRDRIEVAVRADERARLAGQRDLEVTDLRRQRDEAVAGRQEAERGELELRSQQRAMEERERNVELVVARQVEAARTEAKREAEAAAAGRIAELEAKAERLQADATGMARRAEAGSAQERGYARQELLASELRLRFPTDDVEVTPRGQAGADVRQTVRNRVGESAGLLLHEVKWALHWEAAWVPKARSDQRDAGAKVCLLVSEAPPPGGPGVRPLGESLWFADPVSWEMAVVMIRESMLEMARQEAIHAQDADADHRLLGFVTSPTGGVDLLRQLLEGLAAQTKGLRDEQVAQGRSWQHRQNGLRDCSVAIGRFIAGLEAAGAVLPDDLHFALPGSEQRAVQSAGTQPALRRGRRICRACGEPFDAPSRPGRPPVVCEACRAG